jgi:hypothetical protein
MGAFSLTYFTTLTNLNTQTTTKYDYLVGSIFWTYCETNGKYGDRPVLVTEVDDTTKTCTCVTLSSSSDAWGLYSQVHFIPHTIVRYDVITSTTFIGCNNGDVTVTVDHVINKLNTRKGDVLPIGFVLMARQLRDRFNNQRGRLYYRKLKNGRHRSSTRQLVEITTQSIIG